MTEVHYTVPWLPGSKGELTGEVLEPLLRIVEIIRADRSSAGITLQAVARILHAEFPDEALEDLEEMVGLLIGLAEDLGLAYQADLN